MTDKARLVSLDSGGIGVFARHPHGVISGQLYYRFARSCVPIVVILCDLSLTKNVTVVFMYIGPPLFVVVTA